MSRRTDTTPDVSVTVVAYNSADRIRQTLASARDDARAGLAELLVVDNASPDESATIVEREFPEVQLLRSERNRGFAGGCNLAWPEARGRYWLLLNPDAVLPAGGLKMLVDWMDAHPEIGAASPKLTDRSGVIGSPGRRFPSISLALLELSRLHLLLPRRCRSHLMLGAYAHGGDQLDVDFVPGTALIARREAVEETGLLSEEVLIYGEDSEWCMRMRRAGWKIGVCSGVVVRHDEGDSTRRTWGDEERMRRMCAGIYDSCRVVRGKAYARVLFALGALSFAIEANHPRRSPEQRANARRWLHLYTDMLKGWKPEPASTAVKAPVR